MSGILNALEIRGYSYTIVQVTEDEDRHRTSSMDLKVENEPTPKSQPREHWTSLFIGGSRGMRAPQFETSVGVVFVLCVWIPRRGRRKLNHRWVSVYLRRGPEFEPS